MHHQAGTETDNREEGFTLIELLVACALVAVIAAVAIATFINQRVKAVDVGLKADLTSVAKLAESLTTDTPANSDPFSALDFSNEGFTKSPSNEIEIAGDRTNGYCVRGVNPDSSADNAAGDAFWFDSKSGGLTQQPGPAPLGGACAGISSTSWVALG